MVKWRVFKLDSYDGYTNMDFDQAILEDVINGGSPTIRFSRWKPKGISLGYDQKAENIVDVEKCQKDNIVCVKRITGGGILFHGEEEIWYSFVAPATLFSNIEESYRKILTPIMKVIKSLNIDVKIGNENDLIVENRKISVNFQLREQGVILQHGNLLITPDLESMKKYIHTHLTLNQMKEKVIGVSELSDIKIEELYDKLIEEFMLGKDYEFGDYDLLKDRISEILAEKKTQDINDQDVSNGEESRICYFG